MPIKTLFVPSDGSINFEAVLDTALAAARRFDAHIDVYHVRTDPADAMRHAAIGGSDTARTVFEEAKRDATERAKEIRASYEECCAQNSIPIVQTAPSSGTVSIAWHEITGRVGAVVAHYGRLADLIVVDRPINEFELPPTLEASLTETGRPVLVGAPSKAHKSLANSIAIGWNGSVEAASALADAMPFLAAADNVAVLTTEEGATTTATPADVASHLAWHGIAARQYTFETGSQSVGEALLARVQKLKADLLVLGGFGPIRVGNKGIALGDVTRHVLAHAEIPVLIGH